MDSYAMIAFFENEPGAEKVALILKSLLERKAKAYMSAERVNENETHVSFN
jgi:hypothetical protein